MNSYFFFDHWIEVEIKFDEYISMTVKWFGMLGASETHLEGLFHNCERHK